MVMFDNDLTDQKAVISKSRETSIHGFLLSPAPRAEATGEAVRNLRNYAGT